MATTKTSTKKPNTVKDSGRDDDFGVFLAQRYGTPNREKPKTVAKKPTTKKK